MFKQNHGRICHLRGARPIPVHGCIEIWNPQDFIICHHSSFWNDHFWGIPQFETNMWGWCLNRFFPQYVDELHWGHDVLSCDWWFLGSETIYVYNIYIYMLDHVGSITAILNVKPSICWVDHSYLYPPANAWWLQRFHSDPAPAIAALCERPV